MELTGKKALIMGSASHQARRMERRAAGGATQSAGSRSSLYQSLEACQGDMRARRLGRNRESRWRPGGVGLRRVRGSYHSGHSRPASGLGDLPRWIPRWRIVRSDRGARGPRRRRWPVDSGALLLFSSGYFLRVLAACWLGLPPQGARHFLLDTTSLSSLAHEDSSWQPAIGLWNDTHHLSG